MGRLRSCNEIPMNRPMKSFCAAMVLFALVSHAPFIVGQEVDSQEELTAYGDLGSLTFRVASGIGLLQGEWSEHSAPGFTLGLGVGVHLSRGVRPELQVHYYELNADGASPRMFSYFLGFRFIVDLTVLTIEPSFLWGLFDPVENCVSLPDGRQPCYDPGGNGPKFGLGIHVPITDVISVGADPSYQAFGDGRVYGWWDFPVVVTLRFDP